MDRELLLQYICPTTCTKDCIPLGRNNDDSCDYCDVKLNELLDKYDKHVIEQYKANTNLKETIKDIHDNVSQEMYCKGIDDFVEKVELKYLGVNPDELYEKYYPREICEQIKEIAEELKAGGQE